MLAFADREPSIMKYYEQEIERAQEAQSRGLSEPEPLRPCTTIVSSESAAMIRLRAIGVHLRTAVPTASSLTPTPFRRIPL